MAYSACLVEKIEEMIETGKAPYPVERTLIVSGILDHCLESKIRKNNIQYKQIATNHSFLVFLVIFN